MALPTEAGQRLPLELTWAHLHPQLIQLAYFLPRYGNHGTKWANEIAEALGSGSYPFEVFSIVISAGFGDQCRDEYRTDLIDVGMFEHGDHVLARLVTDDEHRLEFFATKLYGSVVRIPVLSAGMKKKDPRFDLIQAQDLRSVVASKRQNYLELEPYRVKEYTSLDSDKPGVMVEAKWYVVQSDKLAEDNTPTRF